MGGRFPSCRPTPLENTWVIWRSPLMTPGMWWGLLETPSCWTAASHRVKTVPPFLSEALQTWDNVYWLIDSCVVMYLNHSVQTWVMLKCDRNTTVLNSSREPLPACQPDVSTLLETYNTQSWRYNIRSTVLWNIFLHISLNSRNENERTNKHSLISFISSDDSSTRPSASLCSRESKTVKE